MGIAAFMALNANRRIGVLFELCIIGAGLSALALMFDFSSGTDPFRAWFTWIAIINALAIVVTSYMARQEA